MKTIQVTETDDGRYFCETGIMQGQWLDLLRHEDILDKSYVEVLAHFLKEPGYKAFCSTPSKEYGCSDPLLFLRKDLASSIHRL